MTSFILPHIQTPYCRSDWGLFIFLFSIEASIQAGSVTGGGVSLLFSRVLTQRRSLKSRVGRRPPAARTAAFSAATLGPWMTSIFWPAFQRWKLGTLETPSRLHSCEDSREASPITLKNSAFEYSSEIVLNVGSIILQGPHHL